MILSRVLASHGYDAYTQVCREAIEALRKRTGVKIPCHILICPADPWSNCFTLNITAAKFPGDTTLSSFANPSRVHPLAEKKEQ